MDTALAQRAGELAEQHGLRGYDAVHLASALMLATDTTFVSWDHDLQRAAAKADATPPPRLTKTVPTSPHGRPQRAPRGCSSRVAQEVCDNLAGLSERRLGRRVSVLSGGLALE